MAEGPFNGRPRVWIVIPAQNVLFVPALTELNCFLGRFWRDEDGASAAEYALLLAIIAAGMAASAGVLGEAIAAALDNASNCINEGFNCTP